MQPACHSQAVVRFRNRKRTRAGVAASPQAGPLFLLSLNTEQRTKGEKSSLVLLPRGNLPKRIWDSSSQTLLLAIYKHVSKHQCCPPPTGPPGLTPHLSPLPLWTLGGCPAAMVSSPPGFQVGLANGEHQVEMEGGGVDQNTDFSISLPQCSDCSPLWRRVSAPVRWSLRTVLSVSGFQQVG